ncbi:hypothetical protein EXW96_03990 [Paenibacillus sp. JMULE4]|nr:hypothetical protein [Paenibacillus sp. JMULE4]NTZ16751.1 hypothetical protein [Paenibacillus sp. JMULE4]
MNRDAMRFKQNLSFEDRIGTILVSTECSYLFHKSRKKREVLTVLFDPTIYDNLKVVLEGHLYDLDAEGKIRVVGREDLVDLAKMGRTFRMKFVLQCGRDGFMTTIALHSGLTDFAGELRGLHAAGERPGAGLELQLDMPAELSEHLRDIHEYVSSLWGQGWLIRYERLEELFPPSLESDSKVLHGSYRIKLTSASKIDESHMDDMGALLEHLLQFAMDMNEMYERGGWP